MERASTRTVGNPVLLSSRAKLKGRRMQGFGCQGFGHIKQECPTYLKSIMKSKALTATLSDTEPEDDSDNKDDRILNAFTATINLTDGIVEDIVEEEELVESMFEKIDDQDDIHIAYEKLYKPSKKHEKLYTLTTKKLSDVELDCEKLSTKFDEANQTIGALRFENNFLTEKTKKFEAKLFQVRAQLEMTLSKIRRKLRTLGLRWRTLKNLNKRSIWKW